MYQRKPSAEGNQYIIHSSNNMKIKRAPNHHGGVLRLINLKMCKDKPNMKCEPHGWHSMRGNCFTKNNIIL